MSITSLGGTVCIPNPVFMALGTSGVDTLDAVGEKVGHTMSLWKAGNIRNIWLRTGSVTTAYNLKVSLQSVNALNCPSGTILGSTNNGYTTVTYLDSDDSKWLGPFQLGEDVSVTRGQLIAVVIEFNSYTEAGSIQVTRNGNSLASHMDGYWTANSAPLTSGTLTASRTYYIRTYNADDDFTNVGAGSNATGVTFISTGTTPTHWEHASALALWTKIHISHFNVALEYSDGTYGIGNFAAGYNSAVSVSTGTSPNEIGNYLQFPIPFTAVGFWIRMDCDYGGDLVLYDASDNVLASVSMTAFPGEATSTYYLPFDGTPASSVSILADTYYRITFKATSGTATSFQYLLLPESDARGAYELGTNCTYTGRTGSGEWTDTDTRIAQIGLLADQLDDGASAGGGAPRFGDMTGGLK